MKPAYRLLLISAGLASAPALGQQPMPVIAVPPLTTPDDKSTGAGSTLNVAWQASQLIAQDLRSTGEMMAIPPSQKDYYSYPEVTAPSFARWRQTGAKALLAGFVRAQADGRLAVGCYLYDVDKGRELGRIGFAVAADDWRRAAHKCSGMAYQSLTGSPGTFDTTIAYVAETGSGSARVSRIAVMDSDGQGHDYVTPGGTMTLTPRLSPKADRLAFVSYLGGTPHIRIIDLASGNQRPLLPNSIAMSFAPRYSPDGTQIAFSMMTGGNSDIYVVDANGGIPRRLTSAPGIDTDPSFSPDGRRILFESDRSGSQQLYVMNADGSDQRRISFGGGWYGSPAWSPDGERIAFTRRGSDGLRVGMMNADGSDQKVLTSGPRDEGPAWAASSREIIFQRTDAYQRSGIYRLALSGGQPRKVQVPQDGSDPDWSGARD
jgi:TolB protein